MGNYGGGGGGYAQGGNFSGGPGQPTGDVFAKSGEDGAGDPVGTGGTPTSGGNPTPTSPTTQGIAGIGSTPPGFAIPTYDRAGAFGFPYGGLSDQLRDALSMYTRGAGAWANNAAPRYGFADGFGNGPQTPPPGAGGPGTPPPGGPTSPPAGPGGGSFGTPSPPQGPYPWPGIGGGFTVPGGPNSSGPGPAGGYPQQGGPTRTDGSPVVPPPTPGSVPPPPVHGGTGAAGGVLKSSPAGPGLMGAGTPSPALLSAIQAQGSPGGYSAMQGIAPADINAWQQAGGWRNLPTATAPSQAAIADAQAARAKGATVLGGPGFSPQMIAQLNGPGLMGR